MINELKKSERLTSQPRRVHIDFREGIVGRGTSNGRRIPRCSIPKFTIDSYISTPYLS